MKPVRMFSVIVGVSAVVLLGGCAEPPIDRSTENPSPSSSAPSPSATETESQTSADDAIHTYILIDDDGSAANPVVQDENGDSNMVDAFVASVKIMVQGSQVVVYVCGTQDATMQRETCNGDFASLSMDSPQSDTVWTGTRNGSTAIVASPDKFLWGTVTFAGDGSSAAATVFALASGCLAVDGSKGTHDSGRGGVCV